jgi:hypothetical protein
VTARILPRRPYPWECPSLPHTLARRREAWSATVRLTVGTSCHLIIYASNSNGRCSGQEDRPLRREWRSFFVHAIEGVVLLAFLDQRGTILNMKYVSNKWEAATARLIVAETELQEARAEMDRRLSNSCKAESLERSQSVRAWCSAALEYGNAMKHYTRLVVSYNAVPPRPLVPAATPDTPPSQ